MTERALPAIGSRVPPLARPAAPAADIGIRARGAGTVARAATRDAVLGTPARAGMLLGASAAVYAVSLAGVALLQAETDAATVAERAPYLHALAESRAANDRLEARLRAAAGVASELVARYDDVGTAAVAHQARLDELAALVAEVEGTAAALPTRIRLPSVSVRGPVTLSRPSSGGGGGSSAPRTSGRTGASGG